MTTVGTPIQSEEARLAGARELEREVRAGPDRDDDGYEIGDVPHRAERSNIGPRVRVSADGSERRRGVGDGWRPWGRAGA